jgi:hypothetical protein
VSFSGAHAIAQGDVLAVLRELPDNEFDALLCDPPYGFSFMGKKWDYDVPSVEVWREALRVLKPGAPLVSFGGTRTFHRVAVGIEDAGFELRDVLSWMYGSGFPKSLNIGKAIDSAAGATRPVIGTQTLTGNAAVSLKDKGGTYGVQVGTVPPKTVNVTGPATDLAQQWDGYGTALKPAWEPAILARKPLDGTVANNVAKWGVGGLAIDACRIGRAEGDRVSGWSKTGSRASENVAMSGGNTERDPKADAAARWPANVAMDEDAAAALDAQAGNRPSSPYPEHTADGAVLPLTKRTAGGYSDDGGPSRFFYCAKVSTREREHGCAALPQRSAAEMTDSEEGQARLDSPRTGAGRGGGARNHHPTLKPIALAKWLARLIMPPSENATLLVPFSGAGSEMIGALTAGWPMVFGIEGEQEYIDIAHARIAAWAKGAP